MRVTSVSYFIYYWLNGDRLQEIKILYPGTPSALAAMTNLAIKRPRRTDRFGTCGL
jgi:hypothetical protein